MKKVTSPSKPNKPKMPKLPSQTLSLPGQQIDLRYSSPTLRGVMGFHQLTADELLDLPIKEVDTSDYHDCHTTMTTMLQMPPREIANERFDVEMGEYEKRMVTYNRKLTIYEAKLAIYEVERAKYLEWKEYAAEQRDLRQLAKLKAQYERAEE